MILKVRGGLRRFEEVRAGSRRSKKLRESWRKSEKVLRKYGKQVQEVVETNWESWKSITTMSLLKSFWGAVDHECWVAIDSMCATSWAHAPELDSNSTSTRDRPEIVTTASFTGPAPRDSEFLTFCFIVFVSVKSFYAASARLKSFYAASARLIFCCC